MNITIDIEEKSTEKFLKVSGEVDAYTAPTLKEKILPLGEEENIEVHVDLSDVNYMDSTGLGVFIALFKVCTKNNSSLKFSSMTERVERLFKITGLHELMEIDTAVRGDV